MRLRRLETAVRIGRRFLLPIAIPAWAVERIIRRWNPTFEFGYLNAAPYFTVWALIADGTAHLDGPLVD